MRAPPSLAAWLDDFLTSYYRHRPVNATFIGVHDHDERLPDLSEDGLGDALADAESLLARVETLPAGAPGGPTRSIARSGRGS